jgi:hypothetical protein
MVATIGTIINIGCHIIILVVLFMIIASLIFNDVSRHTESRKFSRRKKIDFRINKFLEYKPMEFKNGRI